MPDVFEFDVFLSHNKADKPRVRRLAERLRGAGLRVWFDEWVIQPGDDIYLAIERGLEASRTLILCLSPAALGSDWVALERSTALFRDPANTARRFIPLLLADCKLPDTLRRYKYVDYRQEADPAFDQLLGGCRHEGLKSSPAVPENPRSNPPSESERKQTQEEQDRRADEKVRSALPPGVKLVQTLRGHKGIVSSVSFSPQGGTLASGSFDRTVKLWDFSSGQLLRTLEGHQDWVRSVSFSPQGGLLASGSDDKTVKLWDCSSGQLLRTLKGHQGFIYSVSFSPQGGTLASGSYDRTVKLWDCSSGQLLRTLEGHQGFIYSVSFSPQGGLLASGSSDTTVKLWDSTSGQLLRTLEGHKNGVSSVSFSPQGCTLASGSDDNTVKLWDISSGRLVRTLEGHTGGVMSVSFSGDGRLLASKGEDGTIRLWSVSTGVCVAVLPEPTVQGWFVGLSFHPREPLLAAVGSDADELRESDEKPENKVRIIHIYRCDPAVLFGQPAESSAQYVNAKVVLVGDTGVGKSGLSLVLNGQPYKETDSTAGRHVWTLDSQEVPISEKLTQTRETLLWDLAGQPGYRVIHQLHLNEVAVALVVFDARSETDPLAGVRHWERALRLAQQRSGTAGVPMKKYLVSARNDRGTVSVSKERLNALLEDAGFDGYFETSAKEGWKINELRAAIAEAIDWKNLPEVASSQLFADIKAFLLEVKETRRLLAPATELYDDFARRHPDTAAKVANLRAQFDTCIGRLENRDLIRRLSFGDYVLLQPELLDAYASAMVNTAKEEPDGLGSLAEETALAGKFFVPTEQKVADPGQEQLLLAATVEELVRHDLALRENADDGRYLVFPSQFNRDYEDAPEPKGKTVAITFEGPVQSLYATLAVRLGHSELFSTKRIEMWRNAAIFTASAGGKCGLFLHEFAEGRGRLILFFRDQDASLETQFNFEEFVVGHTRRRALDDTVELVRFFVCAECGEPVPDAYVKMLRGKGKTTFDCPCGATVSLADPKERIHFRSQVEAMEKSADRQRDFDAFVMSAKGETSTRDFQGWAGGDRVTLAIVFTDVVGSTAMGEALRDETMNEVRRAHFTQSRKLIGQFKGREVKTIGDAFMAAFKSADAALDYALALQENTGHPEVRIRAGIHIGPMHVEEGDVFGGTVNFAARVVGAIKDKVEIWLSDAAKTDIDRLGAIKHKHLEWEKHEELAMKGFSGPFTLWSLKKSPV